MEEFMIKQIKYSAKNPGILTVEVSPDHPRVFTVLAYSPAVEKGRPLGSLKVRLNSDEDQFTIDRYEFGRDGIYLRYEIPEANDGVHYLNKVTDSAYSYEYPNPGTKKGLRMQDIDDGLALGAKHDTIDVPVQDVLRTYPEGNTEPYEYGGREWHVNMVFIRELDEKLKRFHEAGVVVTLTLVLCMPVDERLWKMTAHPKYASGRMSAFNVITDEGVQYYECLFHFLAERYTREDAKYGRIYGIIVGNEVTVQSVWYDAGRTPCAEFCKEYLTALRLAWTAGVIYFKDWRSYASLDDHWGGSLQDFFMFDTNGFYRGKEVLEYLSEYSRKEGNFYWGIAYHPYSQNLMQADFWNDPGSTDDYETSPVVSFKNLNILRKFVEKPSNTYEGNFRKIILSEQGFHSYKNNYLGELIQAFAYGKAYKIAMEIPEIESFIYHSHFDNSGEEFGLKLGLYTDTLYPKLIRELFRTIDLTDPATGLKGWERF